MESMRDTRRIMEKEIKKGSTPLRFEKISIDETCYQEIISREKFLEVLRYLHRVGEYKTYANKMVINNVCYLHAPLCVCRHLRGHSKARRYIRKKCIRPAHSNPPEDEAIFD